MEGSKGEEAFDSLGLNPQLLINEILNMVDDVVDAAFDCYHKEAVKILGCRSDGGSIMSEDLARGISNLHFVLETTLDKQLSIWEKYCLNRCFSVPEEFVLQKNLVLSGSHLMHSELPDEQLDLQLNALQTKLEEAGKKNEELQREIHLLEKQTRYDAAVLETVQLFEQNSVPQIFKDLEDSTSKLQKELQEAMLSLKDDAGGLIKINTLKEGIMKADEDIFSKFENIQDVVKILGSM